MDGRTRLITVLIVMSMPLSDAPPRPAEFQLSCPISSVTVEAGETVILPCVTKPEVDVSIGRVEWLVNEEEEVCLYRKKPNLNKQQMDCKGNASLFLSELPSGNCSLNLTAQMSHSGEYLCRVRIGKEASCAVNLTVLPRREINTPPGSGSILDDIKPSEDSDVNKPAWIWVLVGLACVGVGGLIIWIITKYFKRKRAEQPNNGDERERNPLNT